MSRGPGRAPAPGVHPARTSAASIWAFDWARMASSWAMDEARCAGGRLAGRPFSMALIWLLIAARCARSREQMSVPVGTVVEVDVVEVDVVGPVDVGPVVLDDEEVVGRLVLVDVDVELVGAEVLVDDDDEEELGRLVEVDVLVDVEVDVDVEVLVLVDVEVLVEVEVDVLVLVEVEVLVDVLVLVEVEVLVDVDVLVDVEVLVDVDELEPLPPKVMEAWAFLTWAPEFWAKTEQGWETEQVRVTLPVSWNVLVTCTATLEKAPLPSGVNEPTAFCVHSSVNWSIWMHS